MLDKFKKYILKYERLASEPTPEVKRIPVQFLGLATGRVVIVRRAK